MLAKTAVFFWAALGIPLAAQVLLLKPDYSAASITSAAGTRGDRLAVNGILTIYGSNLSTFSWAIREQDLRSGSLPLATPNGEVYVQMQGLRLPLFFVSPTQINALMPPDMEPGVGNLRVFRSLVSGPAVAVKIAGEAPEIFRIEQNFVAATHVDGSIVSAANPAKAGEIVVIYGTGWGAVQVKERNTLVPTLPSELKRRGEYRVRMNGAEVEAGSIYYVGVTPGFAGLYQVNLRLPERLSENPTIEIGVADDWSEGGTRLYVRKGATEPTP